MEDICQDAKQQGKYPPLSLTPNKQKFNIVLVYTTEVEKTVPKTNLSDNELKNYYRF